MFVYVLQQEKNIPRINERLAVPDGECHSEYFPSFYSSDFIYGFWAKNKHILCLLGSYSS
jgi:hypothetical protein